jgi:integrase
MSTKRKTTSRDGLYRRPDSAIWWATYTDAGGKRVRRSTGTSSREEAAALRGKWQTESYRQKHWDEQPRHTFDELMVSYLTGTADKRRNQNGVQLVIKRLRMTFGGVEMETLNAAAVAAYIQTRRGELVANATINRELEVLSAAIRYGVNTLGWALPNPASKAMLREPEGRVRWLTPEQADALLAAAHRSRDRAPHLVPLITLALHTGMRRGEMLGLEWSRVDLKRNLIYLEGIHTKAGKRRSVALNGTAREALLAQARFRAEHCPDAERVFCTKEGEPIHSVQTSFETACRRAKITDFRFHDLRHTCAAWLIQAGVSITQVRDVLGHSTVTMTERYAHLAPESVRAAVAVLDDNSSRLRHGGNREGKAVG